MIIVEFVELQNARNDDVTGKKKQLVRIRQMRINLEKNKFFFSFWRELNVFWEYENSAVFMIIHNKRKVKQLLVEIIYYFWKI